MGKKSKYGLVVFIVLCFYSIMQAQNLVPNNGFEILTACPDKFTTQQIGLVPPWSSPTAGTPNIYNTCSTTPGLSVPANSAGYEPAHGGNGYAGIETSMSTRRETEYIQVPLLQKLLAGKNYYFEMFVSLVENCQSVSRLGVHFSMDSLYFNQLDFLNVSPQIFPDEFILQKNGWYKISGIYNAKGGEQYLIIGNFEPNTVFPNLPFQSSYYFIDDIALRDTCLPVKDSGILPDDTVLCMNQLPLILKAKYAGAKEWMWSTLENKSEISITYADQYWVWVSDGKCSFMDTIRVNTNPVPHPDLGSDRFLCPGDTLQIHANAGQDKILWFNNSSVESVLVSAPATVWLTQFNKFNCSQTDTLRLDTFIKPSFTLGNDTFICSGSNLILSPDKSFQKYLWQDGSAMKTFLVIQGGTYKLQVTDANQCKAENEILVEERALPEILLNDIYLVCEPNFILNPGLFKTYLWQDGSEQNYYQVNDYGIYNLLVSDWNNCINSKKITVKNHCPGNFYVPNIFSPNNDGLNDFFRPVCINMEVVDMLLFNSFGETIFSSGNPKEGWDGTFSGVPAPAGVYGYRINGISFEGKEISRSGNFTLIR